jgi:polyhydroxyalkanoate synthesis regulator phasin
VVVGHQRLVQDQLRDRHRRSGVGNQQRVGRDRCGRTQVPAQEGADYADLKPMTDEPTTGAPSGPTGPDSGVADALRTAVERTMRATAGSAQTTRDRAGELVDEVVRRGRDARDELARRGQEAGVELARRGQEATGEIGRRVETLERRLAELEGRLIPADAPTSGEVQVDPFVKDDTDPEVEP